MTPRTITLTPRRIGISIFMAVMAVFAAVSLFMTLNKSDDSGYQSTRCGAQKLADSQGIERGPVWHFDDEVGDYVYSVKPREEEC